MCETLRITEHMDQTISAKSIVTQSFQKWQHFSIIRLVLSYYIIIIIYLNDKIGEKGGIQ